MTKKKRERRTRNRLAMNEREERKSNLPKGQHPSVRKNSNQRYPRPPKKESEEVDA